MRSKPQSSQPQSAGRRAVTGETISCFAFSSSLEVPPSDGIRSSLTVAAGGLGRASCAHQAALQRMAELGIQQRPTWGRLGAWEGVFPLVPGWRARFLAGDGPKHLGDTWPFLASGLILHGPYCLACCKASTGGKANLLQDRTLYKKT